MEAETLQQLLYYRVSWGNNVQGRNELRCFPKIPIRNEKVKDRCRNQKKNQSRNRNIKK